MEKQIKKIPDFRTLKEMAEFWDTHDVTDFEDELEEVREPVFKNMNAKVVPLMLDTDQYVKLKRIAAHKKIDAVSLVNQWIRQQIQEESIRFSY